MLDSRRWILVDDYTIGTKSLSQLKAGATIRTLDGWKTVVEKQLPAKRHAVGEEALHGSDCAAFAAQREEPDQRHDSAEHALKVDIAVGAHYLHGWIAEGRKHPGKPAGFGDYIAVQKHEKVTGRTACNGVFQHVIRAIFNDS